MAVPLAGTQQRSFATGEITIPLRVLLKDCVLITAMIGVAAVHSYAVLLILAVLTIAAMRSTLMAVQALSILFLLIYINPLIQIPPAELMIFRWAVFFAACGRIYAAVFAKGGGIYQIPPIRYLHIFCALALVANFVANPASPVGYLKLFSFAFGTTALFAGVAFNTISRDRLFVWLLAVCVTVVWLSAPLLASEAGYFSKMRQIEIAETMGYVQADPELLGGFMGILSHAQSFGTVAAMMATFLFVTLFFSRYRLRWIVGATLAMCVVMLFLSKARTGGMAFVLAVGVVMLAALLNVSSTRRPHRAVSMPILPVIIFAGLALLGVLLVAGGSITEKIQGFVAKGANNSVGLLDAYQESRGGLIELSIANFVANPAFGIGFGRNSWEALGYENSNPSGGLLSLAFAPTEKGQIVTAVLEETGIFGFLAFLVMIGSFTMVFVSQANVYGLGLLVCVVLLNMGEMNFFAMGGLGMLEWIFIACSGVLADRCSDPIPSPLQRAR